MKTKEEIEQLAQEEYPYIDGSRKSDIEYTNNMRRLFCSIYTQGYTQCQQDMADYIFEVARQFHRLGKYSGTTSDSHFTDIYKETINALNKKDNDK